MPQAPFRWIFQGDNRSVVLIWLVAVLPAIGMVAFMEEAGRNAQLASRQRLVEAYRAQLETARRRWESAWSQHVTNLTEAAGREPPAAWFARHARDGNLDGAILRDADGHIVFPITARPSDPPSPPLSPAYAAAQHLELSSQDLSQALAAYQAQRPLAPSAQEQALCLQGEIRCLLRLERFEEAWKLAAFSLDDPTYRAEVNHEGRWITPHTQLMVLEAIPRDYPTYDVLWDRLAAQLNNYESVVCPSAQRVFLMRHCLTLGRPNTPLPFATLAAESRSLEQLEAVDDRVPVDVLVPAAPPACWQWVTADRRLRLLITEATLQQIHTRSVSRAELPAQTRVAIYAPQREAQANEVLSIPLGPATPGWRLAMHALHLPEHAWANGIDDRRFLYRAGAVALLSCTSLMGLLATRTFYRQSHLAKLKNDLLGSVAHELKTPVASMRLLVDTLLNGRTSNEPQVREYLQLMAKENHRLSRVIDNFLTYSRFERQAQAMRRENTTLARLVDDAIDAGRTRLLEAQAVWTLEVATPAAQVSVNRDAIITLVLNLLDNACKYSTERPEIKLRAASDSHHWTLSVTDRGIGIPESEQRQIFEPFVRSEQQLNNPASGCGLGLSIVQQIARAHGGSVRVDSSPGSGSTFTLTIPHARVQL